MCTKEQPQTSSYMQNTKGHEEECIIKLVKPQFVLLCLPRKHEDKFGHPSVQRARGGQPTQPHVHIQTLGVFLKGNFCTVSALAGGCCGESVCELAEHRNMSPRCSMYHWRPSLRSLKVLEPPHFQGAKFHKQRSWSVNRTS